MFNIGGGELVVIMLIALIVLGPQRLPDAARQVGKTMGELRRLSAGFQNEMKTALDTVDDTSKTSARRNVLAKDDPKAAAEPDATAGAQPSAPAKKTPPPGKARSATKKAPLKAAAKGAPATKKPGVNGTAVKKAPVKKKAAVVPKAAARRTPSR